MGSKSDQETDSHREAKMTSHLENPYHWPGFLRNFEVTFNGAIVQRAPVDDDSLVHVKKIRKLPMRESDVILAAFPKCGTHWLAEIVAMLMRGNIDYVKKAKEAFMLEFVNDLPSLDNLPSPRLFNSHLPFAHLPEQIVEKKVKIVHVIRNPKDTATSWYHHIKTYGSAEFTFDNFLKGYMSDDYTTNGHQFNYLRQMSEFQKAHPHHPIIHLHFEDLKSDPVSELQKLTKFLGVAASEKFCRDVIEACSFKNLKKADEQRSTESTSTMFRKGIVGDWKNSFTVAQSEAFDELMRQQEQKGFGFTFKA